MIVEKVTGRMSAWYITSLGSECEQIILPLHRNIHAGLGCVNMSWGEERGGYEMGEEEGKKEKGRKEGRGRRGGIFSEKKKERKKHSER